MKPIILKIIKKISDDKITHYASSASYYMLLSFLPFMLGLLSLVKFLPISEDFLISALKSALPDKVQPLLSGIFTDIYDNSSTALTLFTAIALLWASGRGFMTIIQGLKRIYNKKPTSNWIGLRIISSFYSLAFMFMIISSLFIVVFGKSIINFIKNNVPGPHLILSVIEALFENKHLLFPGLLTILFTILYSAIAKRHSKFLNEIPGAVFAALAWYIVTQIYSMYIDHSPNFSYMYGSLTAFIFALIWINMCITFVFIGAEINYFINNEDFWQ